MRDMYNKKLLGNKLSAFRQKKYKTILRLKIKNPMHEFGIVTNLIDIIEKELIPYKKAKVLKVKIKIGLLTSVIPEALSFTFDIVSKGTALEGALLDIEMIPFTIRCIKCQEVYTIEDPFLVCPKCNGFDVDLISGRELEIKEIEIDG